MGFKKEQIDKAAKRLCTSKRKRIAKKLRKRYLRKISKNINNESPLYNRYRGYLI